MSLFGRRFYTEGDGPLDVVAVRGHLADLLLDKIHQRIDRDTILQTLGAQGIRLREWALERTVTDRVNHISGEYLEPLLAQRINDRFLELPGSELIFRDDGTLAGGRILVSGSAGGGKSTTFAGVLERLRTSEVRALPVRFDQLPEGILTTKEPARSSCCPSRPYRTGRNRRG